MAHTTAKLVLDAYPSMAGVFSQYDHDALNDIDEDLGDLLQEAQELLVAVPRVAGVDHLASD